MINFIINVLGDPTIILGLVALIGLLFMRSSAGDTILGVCKTMMGYLILSAGTSVIGGPLEPLTAMIRKGLNVEGVLPLYWPAYSSTMAAFGAEVAIMFIVGFLLNIVLAKVTKFKYLALTVHLQLFWCGFMAVVLHGFGFSGTTVIVAGGIVSGLYFWISTGISAHYLKPVTEEHANFVPSTISIIIAGTLGKLFKKDSKSAEEIDFPDSLGWLKDTTVSMAVVFFLLNICFAFVAGPAYAQELAGDTVWVVYFLKQALTFAGAIAIILYGVRMLLAELIPAFSGIAEKLLPNAKLGLDYPTVYPYASTSVMLGFIMNLLGSIVATLIMAFTGFAPLVLPGVQINFFEGALVGVYANARGGLKNVLLSSFITGFLLQFAVAITFPMTGMLVSQNVAYEAMDFNTIGFVFGKVVSLFG